MKDLEAKGNDDSSMVPNRQLTSELPAPVPPVSPIVWKVMLICGVIIYSSYTILVHICEEDGKLPFSFLAVVFTIEVVKLILSIGMFLVEIVKEREAERGTKGSFTESFSASLRRRLGKEFAPTPDCKTRSWALNNLTIVLPFAIPAVLYCINNNLGMAIQLEMDPATYQVLGNFKILSTAVLFRIIIKRPISFRQWCALGLILIAGIINGVAHLEKGGVKESSSVLHITAMGIVMISIYCTISGLAGVYTEYILKNRVNMSLNVQNATLYSFGLLINGILYCMQNKDSLNLFHGFSVYTWLLVLTQSIGGIFMGFVMKYSNNIVRLFIISSAMVLTTLLSMLIFSLVLKPIFIVSAAIVISAIILYHY